MSAPANPLIDLPFAIPFDRLKPEHVEPAVKVLLERAEARLKELEEDPAEPSYENLFRPLDRFTEALELAMTVVGHWETVDTSPALRAVYNKVRPEVSAFYASVPLRPQLWKRVAYVAERVESLGLSPSQVRFVKKTADEFRRNGADLAGPARSRLLELSRALSEATSTFGQNVVAATAEFELLLPDAELLVGLPQAALDRAREDAEARGHTGFRLTLQAPSMIPAMTYLQDASLRRRLYEALQKRATRSPHSNVELLGTILKLRQEQAELLGFKNFADFVLEDRMAKSGQAAKAFVADLEARSRPAFEREQADLLAFRRQLEGPEAPELQPWDVSYYSEKQRKARFDFDAEQLRPYFALPQVIQGLFATAGSLYGISIRGNEELPRWHPDVLAYDIVDADGAHLASFYADLHPRETKRDGAWMNALISAVADGQAQAPHLGLICANVTPPSAGKPALLSHREVETLFHEFGHLLHHCLSRCEVRSLVGTNVAWDFVELPSQIMENWCWEPESLRGFARHYQTGEPLPDALLEKMRRARTYQQGLMTLRQLGFASLDLALHIDYQPDRDGPVLPYARSQTVPFAPTPLPDDYAMVASFSHLFSSPVGYASGYYSYKWAEVLDADAFTRFQREGVCNPEVGRAFRRCILEPGDSRDPAELFHDFMGRAPSLDALLERSGLVSSAAPTGGGAR